MYTIEVSSTFVDGLKKHKRNEPKVFDKALGFVKEVEEHPKHGRGKPKPLKGTPEGRWSRRLSQRHRFVYRVDEDEQVVFLPSCWGHYDDK